MNTPRLCPSFAFSALLVLPAILPAQEPEPPAADEPEVESVTAEVAEEPKSKMVSSTFSALKMRELGPAITSGRVGDIAVDPDDHSHWYVAASSGGVWETRNRGITWKPIFDGQKSYSIGCVAIDPTDSRTIWVGTGENNSQRSVSYGDGVYKSVDGGQSWQNVGLQSSEHIGRIAIDPTNGDRVFVAAQGPLWSAGGERGLYLTEDGGVTWRCVLEIDEHTGVSDVTMDPRDPDVLLAASYQRRRHVFTLINGGPGSGLHRSTDGGATWAKVKGMPGGDLGRIGLARASSDPDTLYAIVEAQGDKGGVFRSIDGGRRWSKRDDYVSGSPQYYQELFVDPVDADRVYSMDVYMQVSTDGGTSWDSVGESSKHVDNHALWIDPTDTRHLIAGCDGGVYETFDRGAAWRFVANLPITQFYRITADNDLPFYNVYGGTQDNFSMGGPARTTSANGITNRDWFMTLGGDGFETVVDPEDPDVVYSQYQHGGLVRYDRRSGTAIDIKPRAAAGMEPLRWNWNAPLIISPHENERLYFAANYLFRSDDRGNSWRPVSGNLTRQIDRNELEVMGTVWSVDAVSKNRSTSLFGNVVSLAESPVAAGMIVAGTDDGLLQITTDGGESWRRAEIFPEVPELTYVSAIALSVHDSNTVFAAFDNHKRGDFRPYLLRSRDAGATWESIAGDLPERGSVHTVVEDHVDPDLLFCGTEFGVWFTRSGGEKWIQLKAGLPPIAVRDLEIQRRESDLVVGTFGRGIHVLDDYSPLRGIDDDVLAKPAHLFVPKRAWQFVERAPLGRRGKGFQGDAFYRTANPPVGAVFTYHLAEVPETRKAARQAAEAAARKNGETVIYPSWNELRAEDRENKPQVVLTVRDATDQSVVRHLTASASKGMHRVTWDLRHASAGGRGPLAVPGRYAVTVSTLVAGVLTRIAGPEEFEVVPLPGSALRAEDPRAALEFLREADALQRAVSAAARELRSVEDRIDAATKALLATPAAPVSWLTTAHELGERTADLRVEMFGDRTISSRYEAQPPSLTARTRAALASAGGLAGPTATHRESHAIGAAQFEVLLAELRTLTEELAVFERNIEEAGGPTPPGRLPRWKK